MVNHNARHMEVLGLIRELGPTFRIIDRIVHAARPLAANCHVIIVLHHNGPKRDLPVP